MTFSHWLAGARPRTWLNAFAPVIAGSAAAGWTGGFSWWRAILALIVAWALVAGVNFANDYSDGIRGTDTDRSGPLRLTASGAVPPATVERAAFGCFLVAAAAGITLSLVSSPWLILLGTVCIFGAWFYTGGKHPYGYHGLGEVAVFLFFGLVAVLGTQFTQAHQVSLAGLFLAIGVGSISSAVNLANNLRDIPTDSQSGKTTLAVILGDQRTRKVLAILVFVPLLMSVFLCVSTTWWTLLGVVYLPFAIQALAPVRHGKTGKDLIPLIGTVGRAMLIWSLANSLGLYLGMLN
ncbi:1,4-dihydroxy-2-naphthoate polyprenyltransferase [Corynebacterium sp. 3HC-13]|uniref:1,4-dihydroxy-2-naphthoate polyprenyltransferase n=1 Tax=Corynebacterium poyangense TaxID=2684405 RepID=UPI001CCA3323|nr:1,4-dihydroxy-2-naphthoate polyprenyltransferase [Corynebacterium poyangense]MBZ8177652.1 1,4-dihydroxy-2-naphthoate polyprenyltransferase [Corynebacterium poyangense]